MNTAYYPMGYFVQLMSQDKQAQKWLLALFIKALIIKSAIQTRFLSKFHYTRILNQNKSTKTILENISKPNPSFGQKSQLKKKLPKLCFFVHPGCEPHVNAHSSRVWGANYTTVNENLHKRKMEIGSGLKHCLHNEMSQNQWLGNVRKEGDVSIPVSY